MVTLLSFMIILSLLIIVTESLLSVSKKVSTHGKKLQHGRRSHHHYSSTTIINHSWPQQQQQWYHYSKRDPFMVDVDVDANNNEDESRTVNNSNSNNNNDGGKNEIKTRKEEVDNVPELFLKNDDDKDNSLPQSPSSSSSSSSSMSTGLVIIATILFTSFWPLLAILRSTSNPIDGFDIDMFIALKGILDNTTPNGGVSALGLDSDYYNPVIMELPPLSPAEQLVGAIFGPP